METVGDLMLINRPRKDQHYMTILCLQDKLPMEIVRMIIDETDREQREHAQKWKNVHEEFNKLPRHAEYDMVMNPKSVGQVDYWKNRNWELHVELEGEVVHQWKYEMSYHYTGSQHCFGYGCCIDVENVRQSCRNQHTKKWVDIHTEIYLRRYFPDFHMKYRKVLNQMMKCDSANKDTVIYI